MEQAYEILAEWEKGRVSDPDKILIASSELEFAKFMVLRHPRQPTYQDSYFRSVVHHMREVDDTVFPSLFILWLHHMVRAYHVDDNENIINYDILNAIMNTIADILHLPRSVVLLKGADAFVPALKRGLEAQRFRQQNKLLVEEICAEIELQRGLLVGRS
jgi:hypothetical protein